MNTRDEGHGHGHAHDGGAALIEPGTSYSTHNAFTNLILAHIALMVVAWVFVLPIAVMFSVAKSRRLAALAQLVFLAVNALGLLLGVLYDAQTPDLYPNNAHHKLGWVLTWLVSGQALIGLIRAYTGNPSPRDDGAEHRRVQDMHELHRFDQATQDAAFEEARLQQTVQGHRWSRDSGQGTEPSSPSEHGHDKEHGKSSPTGSYSPTAIPRQSSGNPFDDLTFNRPADDFDEEDGEGRDNAFLLRKGNAVDRFVSRNIRRIILPKRILSVFDVFYHLIDRTALIFGFVALLTGTATYGGLFQGNQIFTGLAHLIKGGIFFWYGLLVLGRAVGSFADLGWAWNLRPQPQSHTVFGGKKGRWTPTAEFAESALIFLYGSTNVFLERLGERDDPSVWSHGDLEHTAISVLFIGGGMCGMMLESRRVKALLNASALSTIKSEADSKMESQEAAVSTNPLPATIILILGLTMSAHEQQTALATKLHSQWGYLFAAAALARGITYVLVFLSPPRNTAPSRPPSEFVAAFSLIAGGMLFMISNGDSVNAMNAHGVMASVLFTLASGLAAFLMGWEVLVLAVKGWAARRERRKMMMRMTR